MDYWIWSNGEQTASLPPCIVMSPPWDTDRNYRMARQLEREYGIRLNL